jgi:hypothetical protein
LQAVASKALDEVAEFLAASPEAVATRPGGQPAAAARRAASLITGQ